MITNDKDYFFQKLDNQARYEVTCKDSQACYSISKRIMIKFRLFQYLLSTQKNISVDQDFFCLTFKEEKFQEIANASYQELKEDAMYYLASAEKSPYHLSEWFKKRKIPKNWIKKITEEVKDKKYISEYRFAENYLVHGQSKGHKPLWVLKKELYYKYSIHKSIIEQVTLDIDYDEIAGLENYLQKEKHKVSFSIDKIKKKLLMKGFRREVIKNLF